MITTAEINKDILNAKQMVSEVEAYIGKREGETELVNKLINAGNLLTYCLSRLENAIIPPCKVGDTVYYYSFFSSAIIEGTVQRIIIDKMGVILDTGNRRLNNAEDIGIKFFLTREEAEQALKERN